MTNSSAVIKTNPNHTAATHHVIHSEMLLFKIKSLQDLYKDEVMTIKDMNKLARLLLKHHSPATPDPLKQYDICQNKLQVGVYCLTCGSLPLLRSKGAWICPVCKTASKDAHLYTLNDYYLLIGSVITNKRLRWFCNISSRSIAAKLLTSLDLKQSGMQKKSYL
ncbi:hypothetical protein JCM9157_277 [Halalkalibacter akibai JCM 9157]|uniref:Uncharacterized protein n=2 Tax=Halalkalibacter akibai TaxID=1411 RepID=W4QNN6_HALA3|nr:hypothetical protein JCM9157_277 [Halalkalibacter akibai JCM 9157]